MPSSFSAAGSRTRNFRELCSEVWKFLSEGRTLASALHAHPRLFNESTVHLVEAGEASGNLAPVLQRIVQYLEESRAVRNRMIQNLLYPVFILAFAIVVVIVLLVFLLPKIRQMLDQLGGDLPLITRFLIEGSEFLLRFGPIFLLVTGVVILFIRQWRKTEPGRIRTDEWLLGFPLLGQIYLYGSIFSTTNLMATLLGSGVNTTETLRLVERTIPNRILKAKFRNARRQIQEGVSMVTAIQSVHYMPDIAMDILTVGESTGNLVKSLEDINGIYRGELTKKLNMLTTATVSIALVSAIILVAVIALSVIYSILSVSQSIQV
jgi:type II secretory pathway component PulF